MCKPLSLKSFASDPAFIGLAHELEKAARAGRLARNRNAHAIRAEHDAEISAIETSAFHAVARKHFGKRS